MSTPHDPGAGTAAPSRSLSLFDATSIVVGIIIGATIYQASPAIARSVPNLAALVGIWLAGGLIALVGALCYAELATKYPQSGGNYIYLTRAFGPRMGALYAWAELCVVRPGSIGAIGPKRCQEPISGRERCQKPIIRRFGLPWGQGMYSSPSLTPRFLEDASANGLPRRML